MTTCARCGAEVGDASACPQCGQKVLSPQSSDQSSDQSSSGWTPEPPDWRTDTAERPAGRPPEEPQPAASTPGPPRFPLYADEAEESVSAHVEVEPDPAAHQPVPLDPAPYVPPPDPYGPPDEDADDGPGAPAWLPWAIVSLVMVLVAVGGVWLLMSGGDDTASDPAPASTVSEKIQANQSPTPRSTAPETSDSAPASQSASESAPAGDATDVAGQATATAPRNAPPNVDAFGNRTTYVAANMLDGSPSTCWRMAGDASGSELTFALAAPTTLTEVGLVNGYAKTALVGGRKLNWYAGNRRVLAVQWVFDDGTTLDQQLQSTKQMQTIDLETPVSTSTVTLRLVSVSAPGTGRSARDYTAVSEVSLVGTPAG
jgi:hypothetical protein